MVQLRYGQTDAAHDWRKSSGELWFQDVPLLIWRTDQELSRLHLGQRNKTNANNFNKIFGFFSGLEMGNQVHSVYPHKVHGSFGRTNLRIMNRYGDQILVSYSNFERKNILCTRLKIYSVVAGRTSVAQIWLNWIYTKRKSLTEKKSHKRSLSFSFSLNLISFQFFKFIIYFFVILGSNLTHI